MMSFPIKLNRLKFIFFALTLLLSLNSKAISPELLTQLRSENIIDTTNTLSKQEIKQLQIQNQLIRQQAHVSIIILIEKQLIDTKNNPFQMDAILDQTKNLEPNIEDHVVIFISIDDKDYIIQASDENKNFVNEYYGSGITAPYNKKLSSIDHIILKPLLKKDEFYSAIQNTQTYIQQIALHQEPIAEKQYYENILTTELRFKNYLIFTIWMLIFSFFSSLLTKLLTTQFNLKHIKIIAALYTIIHAIFSIYFTHLNFNLNILYLCLISIIILLFYYLSIYRTSNFSFNHFKNASYIIDIFSFIFIILITSLFFKSYQPRIVIASFLIMLIGAYTYNRMLYSLFILIFKQK